MHIQCTGEEESDALLEALAVAARHTSTAAIKTLIVKRYNPVRLFARSLSCAKGNRFCGKENDVFALVGHFLPSSHLTYP